MFSENLINSDLLLLAQVINALLDGLGTVAKFVMSIVTGVIDGLIYMIGAEIHIPVISDIWQAISGDPLSILDVAALILAIPATIIKAASSTSNAKLLGESSTQELWWALSCITGGLVDASADSNKELQPNNPLALLGDAFRALTFGLSYPSADGLTWYENVLSAIGGVPVVLNVINAILAETESEFAESYNENLPYVLRVNGILNIASSVDLAFKSKTAYLGEDGGNMIANVLGNVPLLFKPMVNDGPNARIMCSVMDVACR
jgi:hypothetical protein